MSGKAIAKLHTFLRILIVSSLVASSLAQGELYNLKNPYPVQVITFYEGKEIDLLPLLRKHIDGNGFLGSVVNSGKLVIADSPEKVSFIRETLNSISSTDFDEMYKNGTLGEWFNSRVGKRKASLKLCVPAMSMIPMLVPLVGGHLGVSSKNEQILIHEGVGFERYQLKGLLAEFLDCEIVEYLGVNN